VFLAAVLVISLAGCAGTAQSGSSASAPSSSGTPAPSSSVAETAPSSTEGWVPEKSITIYVGNTAGGGADLFGRQIAKIINDNNLCPQPVVVENKPGGSHSVMFSWLAEQTGDLYSMGVVSSSYYAMPASGNSPVSPENFIAVSHFCKDPNLLVVPGNSPFNTFEEMIAHAKANPSDLKYAGSGPYSDDAIICEMINRLCEVQIEYVPFTSGGDILAAVLGGHVNMAALGVEEANEHVLNGDLKILAAAADERLEVLPDVPTYLELGYDITQQQSRAIVMEKNVPEEIVQYYSDLLYQVSETPEWKQYLADNCMSASYMDYKEYEEFSKELYDDYVTYVGYIKEKEA